MLQRRTSSGQEWRWWRGLLRPEGAELRGLGGHRGAPSVPLRASSNVRAEPLHLSRDQIPSLQVGAPGSCVQSEPTDDCGGVEGDRGSC